MHRSRRPLEAMRGWIEPMTNSNSGTVTARARKFTNGQTARQHFAEYFHALVCVCACVCAVRVGGDVCIVHFGVATNTREYRKNAGAEQTLLKHMLSTTSTYLPLMAPNPTLDGYNPKGHSLRSRKCDVLPHFTMGEKVSSRRPFKRGTG